MKNFNASLIAFFVFMAIVLIQIAIAYFVIMTLPDWSSRGQFGDIFGVVNALFSGLAFAALIYTVILQREDLAIQKEELKKTEKSQKRTEEFLSQQANSAKLTAELSAATTILAHVNKELDALLNHAWTEDSPAQVRYEVLIAKKELLTSHLDALYSSIRQIEQ